MALWHTRATGSAIYLGFSALACAGSTDGGGAGGTGGASALDGSAGSAGGRAECERSHDIVKMAFDLPDGPAHCVGEYPSFPPVVFEGRIAKTQPTVAQFDGCAPGAQCAPTLAELRVEAPGLDLSSLPLGAFARVAYHCVTAAGASRYHVELVSLDSFGGVPNPAGPGGVLLLAASHAHSVFEDSAYDVQNVPLDCNPDGKDYSLTFTPRLAPSGAIDVGMGETLPFDLGIQSNGGSWFVRNLRSYRNDTPCAIDGCAYSEFDDIAWFIAWKPPAS